MSRHGFSVAYDGKDAEHSIDVESLAPALLAFGKLIREANVEFNGKRATAKVVVVSDFEHKCFNINFDVMYHSPSISKVSVWLRSAMGTVPRNWKSS